MCYLKYSEKVNYYVFLGKKIDRLNQLAEANKNNPTKLAEIYSKTDKLTDLQRKTNTEIENIKKSMPSKSWYYKCKA